MRDVPVQSDKTANVLDEIVNGSPVSVRKFPFSHAVTAGDFRVAKLTGAMFMHSGHAGHLYAAQPRLSFGPIEIAHDLELDWHIVTLRELFHQSGLSGRSGNKENQTC